MEAEQIWGFSSQTLSPTEQVADAPNLSATETPHLSKMVMTKLTSTSRDCLINSLNDKKEAKLISGYNKSTGRSGLVYPLSLSYLRQSDCSVIIGCYASESNH